MQYKVSRRKCTLLKIRVANDRFLCCRSHCLQHLNTFFHTFSLSFKDFFPHSASALLEAEVSGATVLMEMRSINTPSTSFSCLSISCNAFRNWVGLKD